MRGRYYENFDVALTPKAMEILEPLCHAAAEDEFDEQVAQELRNLGNELRARLQRCASGDLQRNNT